MACLEKIKQEIQVDFLSNVLGSGDRKTKMIWFLCSTSSQIYEHRHEHIRRAQGDEPGDMIP